MELGWEGQIIIMQENGCGLMEQKVDKIQTKAKRIPDIVWVVLWFGYIVALWEYSITLEKNWTVITFSIGMGAITLTVGYISNWFRKRNKNK